MNDELRAVFQEAGCTGWLCVRSLGDDGDGNDSSEESGDGGAAEVALGADEPMVPASVVKVLVALEAETWFADGRLDPREPVTLRAADRTPGPVGVSLFADEMTASWRDLVVLALTISDNPATDALLRRVGVASVNATAARLGLHGTAVVSDLRTMLDSIGQDLGHGGWAELLAWSGRASAEENRAADRLLLTSCRALDPTRGTRTTARDMVRLLELVWTDRAAPPAACARLRTLMGHQLTRHRIAAGFRPPVRVAAKSGGLLGVVRNEVGVVEYPDGGRYAAAVFTRTPTGADDAAVNRAIGAATAGAVARLRGGSG